MNSSTILTSPTIPQHFKFASNISGIIPNLCSVELTHARKLFRFLFLLSYDCPYVSPNGASLRSVSAASLPLAFIEVPRLPALALFEALAASLQTRITPFYHRTASASPYSTVSPNTSFLRCATCRRAAKKAADTRSAASHRGWVKYVNPILRVLRFSYASLPKKSSISSSTEPMPAMPKLLTRTFATFGERKAGSVGPRWMFFTPR